MLYTELTKKAMQICFEAHRDQTDKGGMPYVFHPFHLAEQMETEDETCAALLHDVVEDTGWKLEQLAARGFSPAVMEALRLLTHDDRVPYMDYVKALSGNRIAARVKLADLRHNSMPGRLTVIGDKERKRMSKYLRAQAVLTGGEPDLEEMTLRFRFEIPALLTVVLAADGHVIRYTLVLPPEGKERQYGDLFSLLEDLERHGCSTARAMSCLRALPARSFCSADSTAQ